MYLIPEITLNQLLENKSSWLQNSQLHVGLVMRLISNQFIADLKKIAQI